MVLFFFDLLWLDGGTLLDEPLSNLDAKLRADMRISLRELQRELNGTFVYVTHDQGEALSMATRIAVMDRGRVIQIGTPRQVYYEPVDRFVADFIGEMNLLTGQGEPEAGRGAVRLADGTVVRSTGAGVPDLGAACSIMVRPECLSVGDQAPEGASALRGRVVDIAFLGDHTRVTVRTSVGDLVSARWHADRPTSEALEGDI